MVLRTGILRKLVFVISGTSRNVSMGQYRQWLSYQERERRLKAELAALEAELAQLEAALDTRFIEQLNQPAGTLTENLLIQALLHFTIPSTTTSASSSNSIDDQQVCPQE